MNDLSGSLRRRRLYFEMKIERKSLLYSSRTLSLTRHGRPTAYAVVLTCTPPSQPLFSLHRQRAISNLSSGCVGRVRLKSSPLLPAYRQVAREMEYRLDSCCLPPLVLLCITKESRQQRPTSLSPKTVCNDWIYAVAF